MKPTIEKKFSQAFQALRKSTPRKGARYDRDKVRKAAEQFSRKYVKLARAGRLFPGQVGLLSKALLDRLQEH
jgi:hypothetical protein